MKADIQRTPPTENREPGTENPVARDLRTLLLALAALSLLPLWRCLLFGETLGAFDQIRQMAPWNGPKPAQPWDVLQADGILQFYVWRDFVLNAWGQGGNVLFNPYMFGGAPLGFNSQSAVFYPFHILLGLLKVPTPVATGILAWLHLFLGGLGIARLVLAMTPESAEGRRRLIGALVAGGSFILSPFLLGWLALSSVPMTVVWIPWALLGVWRLRSGTGGWAGVGAPVAMMLLAGHLQFSAYGFMAIAAFALATLGQKSARPLWQFGLLLLVSLGIAYVAAPNVGLARKYAEFSHRKNAPSEEGFAAYQGGALAAYELTGMAAPSLTGLPTEPVQLGEQTVSSYWPAFVKRGANYAEGALGIGTLLFGALFLLRRESFRSSAPILAVGALGLLLAFGSPLGRLLYFGFPGWSSTGSPGRAIVLFVIAASVAAGVAIGSANGERPAKSFATYIPSGAAALVLLLSLYFVKFGVPGLPSWIPGASPELIGTIAGSVNLGPALIAGLLGVAALALLPKRPEWALLGLAGSLLTLPLVRTTDRSNTDLTIDAPKDTTVAFINDQWDLLQAAPALVPPNLATLSRVKDLAGYDSLIHRDIFAMLNDVNGQDSAPPANGNMTFIKPTADPRKLEKLGVGEVWTLKPLDQANGWPVPDDKDGILRYRLDAKEPSRPTSLRQFTVETAKFSNALPVAMLGWALFAAGGLWSLRRPKSISDPSTV